MQGRIKDETITELQDKIESQNDKIQLFEEIERRSKIQVRKIMALQDKIERQNDEIYDIRKPTQVVPTPTEKLKIPYLLVKYALSGLVFCVFGMLIALVTKAVLHRCSPPLDQYEVNNESLLGCTCVSI